MKNVILCGFMGSGKSVVGKLVSERLGLTFYDTDEMIVKSTGMPISEIFSKYGEQYFRDLETETIKEFIDTENCLISLGGGLAANVRNHPYLKNAGTVVLLDCGTEETLRRISGDESRPLTAGGSADIIERYNMRKPIYESVADIVINSSKAPDETAENLIKALEEIV